VPRHTTSSSSFYRIPSFYRIVTSSPYCSVPFNFNSFTIPVLLSTGFLVHLPFSTFIFPQYRYYYYLPECTYYLPYSINLFTGFQFHSRYHSSSTGYHSFYRYSFSIFTGYLQSTAFHSHRQYYSSSTGYQS
jgi:hypothetical protein